MAEYVPYRGTAGWSGTDTSKERALYNLRTGKEYNNQQKALELLKDNMNSLSEEGKEHWRKFIRKLIKELDHEQT